MSAPIEFRHWLRQFTLDDLRAGAQPVRMEQGRLYAPPVLQYRYKERVPNGDATVTQWSAWQDVPIVREGDADFHVSDLPVTDETVRQ